MFILFLNGQRRFCCIFSNTICQYWLKHLADVQKENNAMVRNEQRLDCTNLYIRVRLKIRLEFSTGAVLAKCAKNEPSISESFSGIIEQN